MERERIRSLTVMLALVVVVPGAATADEDDGPEDEVMETLMGLNDFLLNETASLSQNMTSNRTTEDKLAFLVQYVWDVAFGLPDLNEMFCYTFQIAPIGNPINLELPSSPTQTSTWYVKIAGFGYDKDFDTVGGGYHTFMFRNSGVLLCPIFFSDFIRVDTGGFIDWQGP